MEDLTKVSSIDLFARITAIRMAMSNKVVTYEKAKQLSQPYLDVLNDRAKYVAKRFGKKPQKFQFAGLARNLSLVK